MAALIPSSQRMLGPMLMFARSISLAGAPCKIKMDPSVRWDDDGGFDASLVGKIEAAAA